MSKPLKISLSTQPKKLSIRVTPTFSGKLASRLQLYCRETGLKDSEVCRIAVEKFLKENNF